MYLNCRLTLKLPYILPVASECPCEKGTFKDPCFIFPSRSLDVMISKQKPSNFLYYKMLFVLSLHSSKPMGRDLR